MDASTIGLFTAFLAGVISFLSPCVLPLVPAYISYVAGHTSALPALKEDKGSSRRIALVMSGFFVLGFSTVFVLLGASASAIGRLLLSYRTEAGVIGGSIMILFGLLMMGLVKLRVLQRDWRFHGARHTSGPLPAYLLGVAFGFGWTPCIGPVLGTILTVSAVSATANAGIALLATYSLGLAVPFLASAAFTGALVRRTQVLRRIGVPMQIFAGAVVVLMGITVLTGQLSAFSYWLLETFPRLGKIG